MTRQPFNILLADDGSDDALLIRMALERGELPDQLHVVGDGVEALAYLKGEGDYQDRKKHPFPDFVLLDLKMPRLNGFEVLKVVRSDEQLGPLMIHVLSASALDYDVQRAYSLGANSYLIKPSAMSDLVRMLRCLHEWHCEVWPPRCNGNGN